MLAARDVLVYGDFTGAALTMLPLVPHALTNVLDAARYSRNAALDMLAKLRGLDTNQWC